MLYKKVDFITQLSKELLSRNIFHKVERNVIFTRRSKVSIPNFNKDISYLLGVIAGDGSLTLAKRKRGGFHYLFRIYSGDRSHLNYFNKLLKMNFGVEGTVSKDKRKKNAYFLTMQNSAIFFYFHLLGSEIGKKKRGILPVIVKANKANFLHFLSGLTDTDGHVKRNRIQLKQKSRKLLKEIHFLTNRFNLNCNTPKVNYTNNIPFYYVRFDNNIPLRLKK